VGEVSRGKERERRGIRKEEIERVRQGDLRTCSIVGGVNEDMELVLKTSSTIVMDVKVSGKYGTILTIAAGVDGRIVWR